MWTYRWYQKMRSSWLDESFNTYYGTRSNMITFSFISFLLPALLPPFHIAILNYFWHEFSRRVNKESCTCSCWDTVFKGPYETGVGKYKHLYFNASGNMIKIWVTTVLCIIIFYEVVKSLMSLWSNNQLRYTMLLLFLSAVFSHYYSWWVYTNYWNDDFYTQWNHQLYFTVTEIFSTWLVLRLANKKTNITAGNALIIVDIAVIHTVAGSADQFIDNVVRRSGKAHQIVNENRGMRIGLRKVLLHIPSAIFEASYKAPTLKPTLFLGITDDLYAIMRWGDTYLVLRDLWLMVPDLLHIVLPLVELFKAGNPFLRSGFIKDLTLSAVLISLGLFIFSCI